DELEVPEEYFTASARKTFVAPTPKPAESEPEVKDELASMTVKELQARADRLGVDLSGITRKADIIEAIALHEATTQTEPAQSEPDEDDVGEMDDEFARTSED